MRDLFLVGALATLCCAGWEEPERFYASRAELVADGVMTQGWVPAWLPQSAHDINLSYDLDVNRVWMRFKFDPDELPQIEACVESSGSSFSDTSGPSVTRSWWSASEDHEWKEFNCRWDFRGDLRASRLAVAADIKTALYWEE